MFKTWNESLEEMNVDEKQYYLINFHYIMINPWFPRPPPPHTHQENKSNYVQKTLYIFILFSSKLSSEECNLKSL